MTKGKNLIDTSGGLKRKMNAPMKYEDCLGKPAIEASRHYTASLVAERSKNENDVIVRSYIRDAVCINADDIYSPTFKPKLSLSKCCMVNDFPFIHFRMDIEFDKLFFLAKLDGILVDSSTLRVENISKMLKI